MKSSALVDKELRCRVAETGEGEESTCQRRQAVLKLRFPLLQLSCHWQGSLSALPSDRRCLLVSSNMTLVIPVNRSSGQTEPW